MEQMLTRLSLIGDGEDRKVLGKWDDFEMQILEYTEVTYIKRFSNLPELMEHLFRVKQRLTNPKSARCCSFLRSMCA